MNKTVKIYGLVDPRSGLLFYVGSSHNPVTRLTGHKNRRWATRNVVQALDILTEAGVKPELKIIEEIPAEQRREREGYWISEYRKMGHPLVNRKSVWPVHGSQVANMGAVIYKWQLESIERIARETKTPRAEIVRNLLDFALKNMPE